jgi:hypothetical protein
MTDTPTPPPSLPEAEPPASDEDTSPTAPGNDTKPLAPTPIIPPPPGGVRPPAGVLPRRAKRRRGNGVGVWLGALGIAGLFGLVIVLVFIIMFLLLAPPEYVDPWVPGRLATRTAQAAQAEATALAFATREAGLAATGTAIAVEGARRETVAAADAAQVVTQGALNSAGTAAALEQTATGGAVALDATRTVAALSAQQTAAAGTLAAIDNLFTQTAVAFVPTETPSRRVPPTATRAPLEAGAASLPTLDAAFDTFFTDDFTDGLNPAWDADPAWGTADGRAFTTVCGALLTVGPRDWTAFAVEVDVDNPGAQVAVVLGYGEAGTLYINFGLGGALWWLVEGAPLIDTALTGDLYDPAQVNRVRVLADERVVTVQMNGVAVAERLLPEAVGGPVGLYACPANRITPTFDNLRVLRLGDN